MSSMPIQDIASLGRELRSKAVSATDLARIALERAEIGKQFVAIAALATERAMVEAAAADRRLADGDSDPLLGIPFGVKDIIATRGAPTSWGVISRINHYFDDDAISVKRLADRGSVMAMKLVTSPLAGGGGVSLPGLSAHGQARNPWDPTRYPGGSSSGSAIAVALGIVPFALGSETGGSTILPSSYCGVTGYRPTHGRVPRTGAMMLSRRLDKITVLAQRAQDCLTVLEAIEGPDAGDRDSYQNNGSQSGVSESAMSEIVIGTSAVETDGIDEPVIEAFQAGLADITRFAKAAQLAELSTEIDYCGAIEFMVSVDGADELRDLIEDPNTVLPDPTQLDRLKAAPSRSAPRYAEAIAVIEGARAEFDRVFSSVDFLATVGFPYQPQLRTTANRLRSSSTVSERLLAAANLAGMPGVAVPVGFDRDGFPVSVHLIGPRNSDRKLLEFAAGYQAAVPLPAQASSLRG